MLHPPQCRVCGKTMIVGNDGSWQCADGHPLVFFPAIEMINHPPHYANENPAYEPINVIEAWELGFNLGNTVKYIARAGKKGDRIEDLKKAAWYLQREIERG